jgi:hypothetical protein
MLSYCGAGGSLGKDRKDVSDIVAFTVPLLPEDKPRHLLGSFSLRLRVHAFHSVYYASSQRTYDTKGIGDEESIRNCIPHGIPFGCPFHCCCLHLNASQGLTLLTRAT